jgi:hypothetical protein
VKRRLLLVALIAYLVAIFFFRPHATPGPPLRDFEAYYAAGQTWLRGGDPYARDIWDAERSIPGVDARRNELLPFVNPPPLLPVVALYARLPYGMGAIAWSATLALSLAVCVAALLALVGRTRDATAWAAVVLAALAFGPISSDLALGQFALVGVAAVALASLAFAREKHARAAIAALVAGLQPTFVPALLAWSRNRRAIAAQVAGALAFLGVWALLARVGNVPSVGAYLQLLHAHAWAEGLALIQFTPGAIAHGLGASDGFAAALQWIVAAVALVSAVAIAWFRRDDPLAVFCAFCALTPLAFPFFHEHDFGLLFIPAFVVLTRGARGPARVWATIALLLVGIDWLGIGQRPDGVAQTLLVALALTAATLGLVGMQRVRELVPLLGAAIAIVAFGALAHGRALPIWPDAMLPFSISPDASVAQIWRAEQVAAGMFAPSALSAGLRTLPLLGAALLAWLSARRPTAALDSRTPSSVRAATP